MRVRLLANPILFATTISGLRKPVREVGGDDPAEVLIGPRPQLFPWSYSQQVLAEPPNVENATRINGIDSGDDVSRELRRAAVSMMRYFHELGLVRLEGRDIRIEAGLDALEERAVTEEQEQEEEEEGEEGSGNERDVDGSEDSTEKNKSEDSAEKEGNQEGEGEDGGGDEESDADGIAGREKSHCGIGPDQEEGNKEDENAGGGTGEGAGERHESAQQVVVAEGTAAIDRPYMIGRLTAAQLRFRLSANMTMDDVPRRLRRIRTQLDRTDGTESRSPITVPEHARDSNGKWYVCGRSAI